MVKHEPLGNLSRLPAATIELIRRAVRGDALVAPADAFEIMRSRPHGHVAAVVGTARKVGLPALLAPQRRRERDLVEALIAARLLDPCSKLATARGLAAETLESSLGESLAVASADEDDLYAAMDWLLVQQARVEQALARRHLTDGGLVLYDVTSTYFEGRQCPLAQLGHSRDGRRDKLQIVFGLLTTGEGCPVAVEVFEGNVGDPKTLPAHARDLATITAATQRARRPLRGQARIALRVGKVLGRRKVGKHFTLEITDTGFRAERDEAAIAREAALDGIYVIRTSMAADRLPTAEAVRSYKRLAAIERAFRSLKTVDLKVRPIHHRKADRVRAHVFLCMLAYYVEWHMRRALAPILFDDDDKAIGEALRPSVVAPAQRSPRAKAKALTKRTDEGEPVHSFQSLLRHLRTIVKNRMRLK